MELDIIFLDRETGRFKRLEMKGKGVKPTTILWRSQKIEKIKDVPDVAHFVPIRKFFRERYLDIIQEQKRQMLQNIYLHLNTSGAHAVWCKDNGKL